MMTLLFPNRGVNGQYPKSLTWHMRQTKFAPCDTSMLCIGVVFILLEKSINNDIAKTSIRDILYYAHVVTVGHNHALLAIDLEMSDFEDALQIVSAQAVNANYIVTRNKKDFINSPIIAILPEEL